MLQVHHFIFHIDFLDIKNKDFPDLIIATTGANIIILDHMVETVVKIAYKYTVDSANWDIFIIINNIDSDCIHILIDIKGYSLFNTDCNFESQNRFVFKSLKYCF